MRRAYFDGTNWAETATFPVFSGSTFYVAAVVDTNSVTLRVSGSFGVLSWNDTGLTGIAPAGARQAFRGLAILP